ncbi:DUF3696 domain-containing protein [Desulfobulbus oligotrophicus]|uniref:DUF3696 domain-containing protein n=1 Tax=Desulfobulbus oligotrophicus TaxID=1909699 RepID=A0A7T5VB46_9BACT|nr:DUF3696 domain-containing protein [Desulfobulbus oligotrophicus]QQG64649.1 DUF3696 domain-containing protein [Desulfobulbus oligotrophicus]
MSITAITIQNFKGIREPIRIEIKPITLLFGPNSAGKSTIVQALHYAREVFERYNLNPDRTLLGGESIDLGGFESLVHQHDKSLPVKMSFELDLSREDLPTYADGEVRYIGTDMLDNAGSGYLLEVLPRISKATIGITIRWSELTASPYAAVYNVSVNDSELVTIEASADGQQIYISKINPYNAILLEEGVAPEDARNNAARLFTETNEFFSPESGDFWGDLAISDLGAMLTPLFQYMNFKNGIPGLSKPINLLRQNSAIPHWEKNLSLDNSIWAEDIEFEDRPNFTRLLSSLIVGPGELVRDGLRKLCYVGPLRNIPGRNHKPATSPDNSRWSNGLAAYDTLFFSDEAFIDQVNEWLTDEGRLNSGYRVEVKKYRELENDHPLMLAILQGRILDEDKDLRDQLLALPVLRRLLIRDEARNIELAPQDIGVGISQVLPVVVAALYHKTGIVAIEQPELHIHPAFQVALGDLFIEQIRQRPDLTFILETHSEHLMLRFLRRIRETGENDALENRTLSPEELSIYFIEQGDSGISCLSIRVDEDGDFIDRWPRGFFTERAGELF